MWKFFTKETGIFADYFVVFDTFFLNYPASDPFEFFQKESRDQFVARALATVLDNWPEALPTWGNLRQVSFSFSFLTFSFFVVDEWCSLHLQVKMKNIFFDGALPSFLGFDHVYEQPGNGATPWQGALYVSKGRRVTFSPSWRAVFDMGQKEVETALPGGPSGSRFSKYYQSGIQGWLEGWYFKTKLE